VTASALTESIDILKPYRIVRFALMSPRELGT
jgi:hypothetical protein